MNSVFEKALLSLLFYTQNHSFIAHDFFSSKLLSLYPFPTFYGGALRAYFLQLSTGSTEEGPSRHNWKIVDWKFKELIIQTK